MARYTALENATRQLDVVKAKLAQAPTAIARMRRCRDRPSSNLSYTTIVSPIDGVVGNRTLRVGQYVQAGTQLMAVVPAAAALHDRKLQRDAAHQRPSGPAQRPTLAGSCLQQRRSVPWPAVVFTADVFIAAARSVSRSAS